MCAIFCVGVHHEKKFFEQFSSSQDIRKSSMCLCIYNIEMIANSMQTFARKVRNKSICKFSGTQYLVLWIISQVNARVS